MGWYFFHTEWDHSNFYPPPLASFISARLVNFLSSFLSRLQQDFPFQALGLWQPYCGRFNLPFILGLHHHHYLLFQSLDCCLILSYGGIGVIHIGFLLFGMNFFLFFGGPWLPSFRWPFPLFLLIVFSFNFSSLASNAMILSSSSDGD